MDDLSHGLWWHIFALVIFANSFIAAFWVLAFSSFLSCRLHFNGLNQDKQKLFLTRCLNAALLWHFLLISLQVVSNHLYFLPLRWCHLHILSFCYFNSTNFQSSFLFESSSVFCIMCSAYGLNKEGDKNAPLSTPLPVGNHSVTP